MEAYKIFVIVFRGGSVHTNTVSFFNLRDADQALKQLQEAAANSATFIQAIALY